MIHFYIISYCQINELSIRKGHATLTSPLIKKLTVIVGICKAFNYPSKHSLGPGSIRGRQWFVNYTHNTNTVPTAIICSSSKLRLYLCGDARQKTSV